MQLVSKWSKSSRSFESFPLPSPAGSTSLGNFHFSEHDRSWSPWSPFVNSCAVALHGCYSNMSTMSLCPPSVHSLVVKSTICYQKSSSRDHDVLNPTEQSKSRKVHTATQSRRFHGFIQTTRWLHKSKMAAWVSSLCFEGMHRWYNHIKSVRQLSKRLNINKQNSHSLTQFTRW